MGWGSSVAVSCGVGHRGGLDPALLWLWLAAVAPIRLPAWDFHMPSEKKQNKTKESIYCMTGEKFFLMILGLD